jgi:hypothetical protein
MKVLSAVAAERLPAVDGQQFFVVDELFDDFINEE